MARNKLFAIMNEEGTPNFWITTNANVHNNKYLITVQNGGIFEGHPSQEARLKAVSQNPVLLAIYFRRLVEAFLKYFIGFNTKTKTPYISGGSIPSISHWMMAVEEDGCKTLHFHFIAWAAGICNMLDFFGSASLCKNHKTYFSNFDFLDTLRLNHVKQHYTKDDTVQNDCKTKSFDCNTQRKYSTLNYEAKTNTE